MDEIPADPEPLPAADVLGPEAVTDDTTPLLLESSADAPPIIDAEPIAQPPDRKDHAAALFGGAQLALAFVQFAGLFLLLRARALGLWPASDPYLFAMMEWGGIFAGVTAIQGVGRIRAVLLAAWTLIVAALAASLGWYSVYRGGAAGMMALTAGFLFIAQILLIVWNRDPLHRYASYFENAWRLAIQLGFALLVALGLWFLAGVSDLALGLARLKLPLAEQGPAPFIMLAIALAIILTGQKPGLVRVIRDGILALLSRLLPAVTFITLGLLIALPFIGGAFLWQTGAAASIVLGLAGLLVLCINGAYRGGPDHRPLSALQRHSEFIASFLLLPLTGIAAYALMLRVGEYGWSAPRVFAAAGVVIFACYAFSYIGAALISLGGGGWMQRLESANLATAFVLLAVLLALATPLADPARLAVVSQVARVKAGAVAAEAFDYSYLRRNGLRFGHDALNEMARMKSSPALARGAFLALSASRGEASPTPTEIGANITVHSADPEKGLPVALLQRDWSQVKSPAVPPCLTAAALRCDAFFVDLDGDGRDEIVLTYGNDADWWAGVLKADRYGQWQPIGTFSAPRCPGALAALKAGHFRTIMPVMRWRDLEIGGQRLTLQDTASSPTLACAR